MCEAANMSNENGPFYTHPIGPVWQAIKPLARQKRHEPTQAEEVLWQRLRDRQIAGAKFRRQHAIERFIVDFYCSTTRLVIEVDGSIHDYTPEEDAARQAYLESLGLRVVRLSNEQVLDEIRHVLRTISALLDDTESADDVPSDSPSPPRGEGAGG